MRSYQTHDPAQPGMSDSFAKLARLRLPADMTGWRVLDIGSNEGFFCNVAATRGASRVVALDFHGRALEAGRARYPHPAIEWLCQNWSDLPEGPFDLILWCSAMHYEADPAAMFAQIAARLAPGGLFALECGVAPLGGREMALVARPGDNQWYPTHDYLHRSLRAHFEFKRVAKGEPILGDPIPREIYHCRPRLPEVLIVRSPQHPGFARLAHLTVTKRVDVTTTLDRLASARFAHNPIVAHLRTQPEVTDTIARLAGIDAAGLTQPWCQILAATVAASDETVVIEGPLTPAQVTALGHALSGRALLWDGALLDGHHPG